MASNFPTSKDTFAQPTDPSTAALSSAGAGGNTRPHLEHHRDLGDVLEAVQDKVGYGPGKALTSPAMTGGFWHWPPGPYASTTPVQSSLYLTRWEWPVGMTITQLGLWVGTAGATATAVWRFGVYDDDGSGCYPGALLLDAGVSTTDVSTTGFKVCTAFSATDVGGVRWWGGALQVAAGITNWMGGMADSRPGMATTGQPGNNNVAQSYSQGTVTGALPSTFTATRAVANVGPRIYFKT